MTPNIQIARKNIMPSTQNKKRLKPPSNVHNKQKFEPTNNKENDYDPNSMEHEVEAGVNLILRFIRNSTLKKSSTQGLQVFKDKLCKDIVASYTGHWYPECPMKGSAYRCLRINQNGSDSLIEKTAKNCDAHWIVESLPKEFTIWIDPFEVSYRIGEEGSICVDYAKKISLPKR